jgi:hypothetical protein
MSYRLLSTSTILFLAVSVLAMPLPGQTKKSSAPRTPDGQPDLQGIWTNSTLTPLERSREFAAKPALSETEATEYENRTLQQGNRDRRDGGAEVDVGRAYNELFFERGNKLARLGGKIRTSMIVDPPDGRIPPMTPEGQRRMEQARMEANQHPADRAQDRSLAERCVFWGTAGPPLLPGPYNNTYQIYQTPGYVMILAEMIHDARIIPLDRRPHVPQNIRHWMGDSRGHWEGDTLVVDTTNFTGKTRFRGSSENLHLVERFTRVDSDTILYRFTVDDPSTFTKSWTAELPLTKTQGPIYEYACHEGNYALVDILAGARAEEAKKSAK